MGIHALTTRGIAKKGSEWWALQQMVPSQLIRAAHKDWAKEYALQWPAIIPHFGDFVPHRFLVQVLVDPESRVQTRKSQGTQWIQWMHRSHTVAIEQMIVECSTTEDAYEELELSWASSTATPQTTLLTRANLQVRLTRGPGPNCCHEMNACGRRLRTFGEWDAMLLRFWFSWRLIRTCFGFSKLCKLAWQSYLRMATF